MPITYTPAKTAQQAPAANPAPNGPTILDANDYNTMNEGIAAVTTFANGLETSIAGKADTSALADYAQIDELASATDAATSGAAGIGAYYDGAASTTQAVIDALVARIAALETPG